MKKVNIILLAVSSAILLGSAYAGLLPWWLSCLFVAVWWLGWYLARWLHRVRPDLAPEISDRPPSKCKHCGADLTANFSCSLKDVDEVGGVLFSYTVHCLNCEKPVAEYLRGLYNHY